MTHWDVNLSLHRWGSWWPFQSKHIMSTFPGMISEEHPILGKWIIILALWKKVVEPAWLWYSLPEVRNRKETESGLGKERKLILRILYSWLFVWFNIFLSIKSVLRCIEEADWTEKYTKMVSNAIGYWRLLDIIWFHWTGSNTCRLYLIVIKNEVRLWYHDGTLFVL